MGVACPSSKSPLTAICVTVILFNVKVPVLSLQITVALPNVSTAGNLRISAFFLAIRCTPKAITIVAVAGMEGALASVLAGLVSVPVFAVPTSVGYGASFGGISALLSMINSCANGVSVVNIDNGFGAGYCAHLANRL